MSASVPPTPMPGGPGPQDEARLTVLGEAWCVGEAAGGLAMPWKEDGQYLWPVSGGEDEA